MNTVTIVHTIMGQKIEDLDRLDRNVSDVCSRCAAHVRARGHNDGATPHRRQPVRKCKDGVLIRRDACP